MFCTPIFFWEFYEISSEVRENPSWTWALWPQVQKLALEKNMRVEVARTHGDGGVAAEIGRYAKFLLDLGDGALPTHRDTDLMQLPNNGRGPCRPQGPHLVHVR